MKEDYNPFDRDEYNPFDEESVAKRRKLFVLALVTSIIVSVVIYGTIHYQIFNEQKIPEKTGYLEPFVIPHSINDTDFDVVVRVRINAYW